jgi:hypothetical protein
VLLSNLLRSSPGAVTRYHIQLTEMIVSVALYEKLRATVLDAISTNRKLTAKDAIHLGVEYDALLSLYGQLFVRNLKTESRSINPRIMKQLVARSQSGESLVDLANEFHFGSFKFAKLYLEAIGEGDTQLSSLLTDPMQIKDARIRKELLQLIAFDPICSPELEQVKECLGREYEELLISLLNQKLRCPRSVPWKRDNQGTRFEHISSFKLFRRLEKQIEVSQVYFTCGNPTRCNGIVSIIYVITDTRVPAGMPI